MQSIRRTKGNRALAIVGMVLAIVGMVLAIVLAGHAAPDEHPQVSRVTALLAQPNHRLDVNVQATKQRPVNGADEASIVLSGPV